MAKVPRTIDKFEKPVGIDDGFFEGKKAKRFDFREGDEIKVKVRVGEDKTAEARTLPVDDPPSGDGFTLKRLVLDLKVAGGADNIEISVKMLPGETKIAYLHQNKWHIIPHEAKSGFFVGKVAKWPDDPMIGAGM